MRVLINALQAGNRSGTGRYIEALIPALLEAGDPAGLAVYWPARLPAPAWAGQVALVRRDAARLKRLWEDQANMGGALRRAGADLVHYPANIGALRKTPSVLTVHDLSFLRHPEWFRWERAAYYRFAAVRSARLARRVIADSQSTAQDLQELAGINADRIDVVPLGVDPAFAPAEEAAQEAARKKYNLPEQFFLYVGTLEPRKNLPRLIAAWDRIAEDTGVRLVLAGREGWKVAGLHAAIHAARHAARIHLPGFIAPEDLAPLLSAARAFVWPSLYEGFGLPVLEAMACGAPVLASNTSSLPEVAGDAALLVDPEDVNAIAAALKTLAANEDQRAQLRKRGLVRAAKFTWSRTAQLTLASYRKALDV